MGSPLWLCLVLHFCAVTVSSTGPRELFKEMTTATSGVLARFPLLFRVPRRHSESHFGPRTFGGSGNQCHRNTSGYLFFFHGQNLHLRNSHFFIYGTVIFEARAAADTVGDQFSCTLRHTLNFFSSFPPHGRALGERPAPCERALK